KRISCPTVAFLPACAISAERDCSPADKNNRRQLVDCRAVPVREARAFPLPLASRYAASPASRESIWLSSSRMSRPSLCNAANPSRPFAVARQVREYAAGWPHTDAATFSVVDLPVEEAPRRWKPPESSPADSSKAPAKAAHTANTIRELPRARAAT